MNGILVAPGFGERGIEGKILAINYARINKIGMWSMPINIAVIETAIVIRVA